jgi:hypothetical protein
VTPKADTQSGSVPASPVRRTRRGFVAIMLMCSCGVLSMGAVEVDARSVRSCGTAKIAGGGTLRVQVARGKVTCRTARYVIRHSHPYATPDNLPSGPNGWTCFHSAGSVKLTITCTKGKQSVLGKER